MAITTTWEDYEVFITDNKLAKKEHDKLYLIDNSSVVEGFYMFMIIKQLEQLNDTLCYVADSIGDRLLQGEINYDN